MTPDLAELYSELGLNIIPLMYREKVPALPSWKAYQTRMSTEEERRLWWPQAYGATPTKDVPYNVGVVTGAVSGNLIVIDLDDEPTYRKLRAAAPDLTNTLTVKTGKGFHAYLRSEVDPGDTFKLLYNGVTHHMKLNGGYVCAPFSVHPSGRIYVFDPDLPSEPQMVDLGSVVATLKEIGFTPARTERAERNENWYDELFKPEGFGTGVRMDTLTQLVGLLRTYLDDRPSLAMGLAHAWNQQFCRPPLSDAEVTATVQNYYRRPETWPVRAWVQQPKG